MKTEEMKIAIAEFCGWKQGDHFEQILSTGEGETWPGWIDPKTDEWSPEPPDYPNDLNAMHEAEEVLTPEQRADYSSKLARWIKDNSPLGCYFFIDFDIMHATALQRAEAFLRTIGKWEEDK